MMKKLLVLAFMATAVFQLSACRLIKRKHNDTHSESIKTENAAEKKSGNVVVSFISFGAGIDFKSVPEFEQFMKDYNARSACGFQYEVKNWGREGERDYCFTGTGNQCFTDFITSLKNKYKGNERILIKENEPCRP